jgi:hypothetical protein
VKWRRSHGQDRLDLGGSPLYKDQALQDAIVRP